MCSPVSQWMFNVVYMHTMEYHSENNEVVIQATTWMNPVNLTLREIIQASLEGQCHMTMPQEISRI